VNALPQTIRVELPQPHPGQSIVLRDQKRFNVLACGRRWGKSVLGVDRIVEAALHGYPTAWFAPNYKLLADAWRQICVALDPVKVSKSDSEHRMEIVTGGIVEAWSLDGPDAARGRMYRRVVIDEAAMVQRLEDAWNGAIRPTLADLQGDAWFCSTPKGRNYFWTLFQRGQDAMHKEWASWKMPTSTNPYIAAEEIAAAKAGSPERYFLQEFAAEFIDDGGGVFRRVGEAAVAVGQDRAVAGHQYVMGVDWGKTSDFTVLSVIDLTTSEQVALDRSNQVDYAVQVGRLRALYDRFKPGSIIAERNSMGEPIIEQLVRDGLPVQPFLTTNATKAEAIEALALAFERAELRILDDPVQFGELLAFDSERLPSGLTRYGAPDGMHDDTVMALALAWQAVGGSARNWLDYMDSQINRKAPAPSAPTRPVIGEPMNDSRHAS
jgi:Terminase RNaseH-like domain